MKHFAVAVAIFGLAATGCAGNRMLNCGSGCAEPCHVSRSNMAPRPIVERSLCSGRGRCTGGMCDVGGGACSDGSCYGDGSGGYACSGDGSCGGSCGLCHGFVGALASGFCPHAGGYPETPAFNPGPPTGQVAYPYYTVRGPRDFLQSNPPSIGPY